MLLQKPKESKKPTKKPKSFCPKAAEHRTKEALTDFSVKKLPIYNWLCNQIVFPIMFYSHREEMSCHHNKSSARADSSPELL